MRHLHLSRLTSSLRAQLYAVKEEEALIEEAASLLDERRIIAQAQGAHLQNALQPCLRLPHEVLSAIFEVGVPIPGNAWLHQNAPRNRVYESLHKEYESFLQSVSLTCATFRSILLRTSKCWVYMGLELTSSRHTPLSVLETRLALSHPQPFELHLNIDLDDSFANSFQSESTILSRRLHRCRSVTIRNSGYGFAVAHTLMSSAGLSSLEHMYAYWARDFEGTGGFRNIASLFPANSATIRPLLSLSLVDSIPPLHNFSIALSQLHSSLDSLTRLRLRGIFLGLEVIQLLKRCAALEHFDWDSSDEFFQPSDTTVIELPHLLSLRVVSSNLNIQLPPINAPLLEQVEIEEENDSPGRDEDEDFPLLTPNQPHLPSLKRAFPQNLFGVFCGSILASKSLSLSLSSLPMNSAQWSTP